LVLVVMVEQQVPIQVLKVHHHLYQAQELLQSLLQVEVLVQHIKHLKMVEQAVQVVVVVEVILAQEQVVLELAVKDLLVVLVLLPLQTTVLVAVAVQVLLVLLEQAQQAVMAEQEQRLQ
jgi:hypothetical protein